MNWHYNFLTWHPMVAKGDVASDLMILIPTSPNERPDEPIPGKIPGELAHTATLTVHSGIAPSSGIGSPCLRQLSK